MYVKQLEERLERIEVRGNNEINKLAKKLDRFNPQFSSSNKTALHYWKDKPIIPLDEWIRLKGAFSRKFRKPI